MTKPGGPVERGRRNRVLNAARHYHSYATLLETSCLALLSEVTGDESNEGLTRRLEAILAAAARTLHEWDRFVPFQDNEAAMALAGALERVRRLEAADADARAKEAEAQADAATAAILKDILR